MTTIGSAGGTEPFSKSFDEGKVRKALMTAWSLETAVQWTPENPASGQCNVTAAVVNDLFGGDILRTDLDGVWHYYNRIDGQAVDLTDSQFTAPGARFTAPERYQDEVTTHAAAMSGIPQREYDTLRGALTKALE
ncbi:hypothetical protein [Thalassococcus sp. S3]|uniref:YunG family protein n=1 Tax=Thalassococcus sp. S3 TaxID=2017482 RepID=UPI0010246AFA|nr:hypothetical protein [Thalassococcus sp. S3]QBF31668.1 hypothetical protein CFI11_10625 [Thalassococcus sp. S3]